MLALGVGGHCCDDHDSEFSLEMTRSLFNVQQLDTRRAAVAPVVIDVYANPAASVQPQYY